jgi:hypothetical protein
MRSRSDSLARRVRNEQRVTLRKSELRNGMPRDDIDEFGFDHVVLLEFGASLWRKIVDRHVFSELR